jgi:hypothetical protein
MGSALGLSKSNFSDCLFFLGKEAAGSVGDRGWEMRFADRESGVQ